MLITNIQTESDITDAQVTYLVGLAHSLSRHDDFTIENFADSAVTSPEVQQTLQMQSTIDLITGGIPGDAAFDFLNAGTSDAVSLTLSGFQQDFFLNGLKEKLSIIFSGLRRKIKRIFCSVVTTLGSESKLDLKAIIKSVLLALIPALASTTGLMAVALPIVVSLAAMLLKYGIKKVCPA